MIVCKRDFCCGCALFVAVVPDGLCVVGGFLLCGKPFETVGVLYG
jgi:hypothetical protein